MRNDIFKKLRKIKRNTARKLDNIMQHIGTKELIAISLGIVVIAFAIILVMAYISGVKNNSLSENGGETQIANEGTSGDADMPVVEMATEETKTESTSDTTVLVKKEGAKKGYLNRCVFLGDSRTVAMVNYGFFNDDSALAQIGISHPAFASNIFMNNAGKEYTMKSYLESHQAQVIYILLGVNGINDSSEDHYKNTFISLIDSVSELAPNSNIVLVSIGPVDDNGMYKNYVQNALIDKYNDFLLETAKEKHIFYLDIAEVLKESDGQVKSEYNGGDGLHYSGKGCEAIFNYIVEHPVPGISDEGEYVVKYVKPDPNKVKATTGDESGINDGNLGDLMDMMGIIEDQNASEASSQSSTVTEDEEAKKKAEEEKKQEEEEKKKEEEQKKAEEEEKKKQEEEQKKEEKKKQEEEQKKEEEKKKQEEEQKKAEEEEEEKKKQEEEQKKEEEKKQEEEEREKQEESSNSGSTENNEGNGDNGSEAGNEASTGQSEGSG
ncbi:GDSL-type esterase/lipase family protein [Butyrivibrio sp. DSM 10294]|uniref:GDSL-type esterase/lipase family protein n=1 Tax=Butyrivibrio sp. DSM 10294 TaxID=2972457 RepID=UPI00234E7B60|nr:GDSL-type esterase/lipase family protein [Butyrivibrio sp. DSM 10294]MDC7293826.1 GDSL-type esterase/lipase family protein [Butyrivibrio sp. DSM 10294]